MGGPDFAVEVASKHDRTWDKLDFYAAVQTRELLVIDRDPWKLSLLRLENGQLVAVGVSVLPEGKPITSAVLPVTLKLTPRENLVPMIEVQHQQDGRRWNVDPVIHGR